MAMAIPSLSMNFSLRLMVYNITYGEQLIRKACPVSGANASPKAPTFGGYGEVVEFTLTKKLTCQYLYQR